jgi:hypothetical protein
MTSKINYSYSFGTPHRLTVTRPDSSVKTILDVDNGGFHMKWTYENLTQYPTGAYAIPSLPWAMRFEPKLEGKPFSAAKWTRLNGYLPILENTYMDTRGQMTLTAAGGKTAAIVKVKLENTGETVRKFSLDCRKSGRAGLNLAWGDSRLPDNALVAGYYDRSDRMLLFGIGADNYRISMTHFEMCWMLHPGEIKEAWVIRPYEAYIEDLDRLQAYDWAKELEEASLEWEALINSASRLYIPDPLLLKSFYACFADLFVMREPFADGYIASTCGTEVYRNTNPFEPSQVPIALDQLGLHEAAEEGIRFFLEQQEPDGNWTGAKGWTYSMWGGSGFKSRAIMEHYKLTDDIAYLEAAYPRMLASSRWQETMRARTRSSSVETAVTSYGLMPRGMGDCGLKDDLDHFGIFYPHNVWAVYADKLTLETAEILGKSEHLSELRGIYELGRDYLLQSMEHGAIQMEEGYRWIPGVPNKTSGSRWGALHALYPARLLSEDHELVNGTIRYMESQLSLGGLPIDTGWLKNGMWVSAALDDLANAHLVRGNGDLAIEYLYSAINHGTPLVTWCEERGQEPGTETCTGDRQHLWTPVAVVRVLRNCMVMEDDNGLQLARGISRHWLLSGEQVGITGAKTHFGDISYQMKYDSLHKHISAEITLTNDRQRQAEWLELHVRLPYKYRIGTVDSLDEFWELVDNHTIRWLAPKGSLSLRIGIELNP